MTAIYVKTAIYPKYYARDTLILPSQTETILQCKFCKGQLHCADLIGFVSLNMAAVRKILKKIAKNLHSDGPHGPGIDPGMTLVSQRAKKFL